MRGIAVLIGLAAVLGALVSLGLPMTLGVVDRTGTPIACGTGMHPDSSAARHEDSLNHQEHLLVSTQYIVSDYAGECGQLIAERRRMAAGVAGVGVVLVGAGTAGALLPSRRPIRQYAAP